MADPRITENVQKMVDLNAPVEHINGYLASEGLTPEQFKQSVSIPDRSLGQSLKMGAMSALPSAVKGGAGILTAAFNPIDTISGALDLGVGELQKVLPQKAIDYINARDPETGKRAAEAANAFNKDVGEAYGSWKNIKNTLATDPFRLAADLSMVAGGAGELANVSKANKLAKVLSKTSEVTNPVGMMTKPVGAASEYFGKSADELNKLKAQNATMDTTINQSQKAGYVIPRSLYNPSTVSNTLESIGGKAATLQDAAKQNQAVTNSLARKYLGLPEDTAFSTQLIDDLLDVRAGPYKEAAQLPSGIVGQTTSKSMGTGQVATQNIVKDGKTLVSDIKDARQSAKDFWSENRKSGSNQARKSAIAADQEAANLESQLETLAQNNHQSDLVQGLRQSRVDLAKIHSIDRAMNSSTGDIIAPELRKQWIKDVPLTGEAKTIAEFGDAFPTISREGSRVANADVSQAKAIASLLSSGSGGGLGNLIAGAPGAVLGAIAGAATPFIIPPAAKSLALSRLLQKPRTYQPGILQSLPKANKTGLGLYQMNQANQNQGEQ
jgi:hypothetical protein